MLKYSRFGIQLHKVVAVGAATRDFRNEERKKMLKLKKSIESRSESDVTITLMMLSNNLKVQLP